MKLINFLTSRAFAIALLVASVVMLVAWTQYPMSYSPLMLILPFLLLLSLVFCTARRMISAGASTNVRYWGSIVFHFGMILGVAIIFLSPLTRFTARLTAVQGVTVQPEDKDFFYLMEEPSLGGSKPPFVSFTLNDYKVTYKDDRYPTDYSIKATVGFMKGNEYVKKEANIGINRPLIIGGYRFLMETGGSSMPHFTLRGKDGKIGFESFVNLSPITSAPDSFEIENEGLIVYTRFFPDMYRDGDKVGTKTPVPKNPAYGIKISRREKPFDILFSGVLRAGDKAEFEGMELALTEMRSFVGMLLVGDPMYYWMFLAWALGVAGLVVRYLYPKKKSAQENI